MHFAGRKPRWQTRQININDAKPASSTATTNNALKDFTQSAMRKDHTHPYMLQSSSK